MWSLLDRIGRWSFTWRTTLGGSMAGLAHMFLVVAQLNGKATPLITLLFYVVTAAGTWIGLAAFVRRLHDVGWSGWWVVLAPIPVAGWIQGFILCSMPGQRTDNRFGAPPGRGGSNVSLPLHDASLSQAV